MKLDAPRLSPPSLVDLEDATGHELAEGTDCQRIEGATVSGLRLSAVDFRESELVDVRISGSELRDCRFLDVRFERLDAPDLSVHASTWRDCEIVDSRLGSIGLFDAKVGSVRFVRCKVGYLGLQGAVLTDVSFEDCTIDELELSEGSMTRARFPGTTITDLRLTGARLAHTDLREARLGAVSPVSGLRGATVSTSQLIDLAPALAGELGIRVD
jgi:uncharacterized protein YjbI with pentapeptide repeats